jgi:NAD(P)-dependent dehydrogenase (short-subunit alcohol dehydrogenase family)
MDFTDRHVIVTGASSGIGRATAMKIARAGGKVSLIARRADRLEQIKQELGDCAVWAAADVADQAQVIAALDAVVHRNGPADGLFLNAGAEGQFAPLADYTDDALAQVMAVNFYSPFWAIRHLLPGMMERGRGSIVITGSIGGETGMVGNPGYCASKHAVSGLAQCVAMEAAPAGVRCNVLVPGFIATEILDKVPADFQAVMAARVPQGRIGTAEEAANVAAFLLSNEASHVTAQRWAVDGGLLGTLKIV